MNPTVSPHHLGKIVLKHEGCWGSDTTALFSNISLTVFNAYPLESYNAGIIIKPIDGTLEADVREAIIDAITRHKYILHSEVHEHLSIELNCPLFSVLDITAIGHNAAINQYINIFGDFPHRDIGCSSVAGWETHYAMFRNYERFQLCLDYLSKNYEVDRDESTFSKELGLLQLNPPLKLEAFSFGEMEFPEYRETLNRLLMNDRMLPPRVHNNWLEIVYDYGTNAINFLRSKYRDIPNEVLAVLVKLLLWIATQKQFDC